MQLPSEIKSNEIHVWTFSLIDKNALSVVDSILSKDELERSRRFVFERDRNRFSIGRFRLRELLSKYTGIKPEKLRFSYNQYGKPSIEGEVKFNLSHSENLISIACMLNRNIGIDIEKIKILTDVDILANHVFTVDEMGFLRQHPSNKWNDVFYRLWTRKEALFKAAGVGIGNELKTVSVFDCKNSENNRCNVRFKGSAWYIADIDVQYSEYSGAISCESGKEWSDDLQSLTLCYNAFHCR